MKVTIIGGGIGGYTCAIRLSQLGAEVSLVERDKMGGTCLNRGCIPTKAILHSAKAYYDTRHFEELGIYCKNVDIDYEKVARRKDAVISKLRSGVEYLMKKNRIRVIKGSAKLRNDTTVEVITDTGREELTSDYIVLATGSRPVDLKIAPVDNKVILDSTGLLNLTEQPDSLIVLGGGVVGCEIAQAFAMMDTEVTVVEMLPRLLANLDEEFSALLARRFKADGIEVALSTKLLSAEVEEDGVTVTLEKDGQSYTISAEKLLVSVGRRPNTEDLGLENAGVEMGPKGNIVVDETMRTSCPTIFAVGDVTGGAVQLAHVSGHQGMIAAENIFGEEKEMDYTAVPSCIYTSPELATIGVTAAEADEEVKVGKFALSGNGRSLIEGEQDGFAKVVARADDDTIIGVQLAGANVTEMISGMAGIIGFEANTDDVSDWLFAHPSVSEAIGEAVLDVNKTAIHK